MAALGASPDFVGRRTEVYLLEEGLERVGNEDAAAFVVAGESGVGKTRLVGEFAGRARRAGATVLVAPASTSMTAGSRIGRSSTP